MYVGRLLVVGPETAAYRVSSRSFPNRQATVREDGATVTIEPTPDAPPSDNPYISYNCLRTVETPAGEATAIGNGSHVDPVAEKLGLGYPPRDALVTALHALDFEKDDYDTPRIAGVLGPDGAYIGTVRRDALLVREVDEPTLVATYEENAPTAFDFDADDAEDAARAAYDLDFEHAVCAAAATRDGDGFDVAAFTPDN
ncbi:IMP cyclohydrolase [Haloglomus litoreum]|uniref:IMP cyclohydrolase n=1 Tax=Haloglomus litoreum TaxID=3034026 RepID=UPI0023E899AF|nr:IMP cyclohydrolase [Haloglomus sp. DT116]